MREKSEHNPPKIMPPHIDNPLRRWYNYFTKLKQGAKDTMAFTHNESVGIFKALADDNRLEILELLMTGERCACELLEQLNISQSTLSHHMHILCESGLVTSHKQGKWMYYSISVTGFENAKKHLEQYTITAEQEAKIPKCDCKHKCCE